VGATSPRWPRKIFSEVDQIALARTLLSIARHNRACLTLHGDAALAKACGADGVHLPAGSDPIASRAMLGPAKLIGVSLHTVTEAEVINPSVVDYAIAGPTFETPSKPGYGPEIGRKGVARIVRAAPVPVLAIGSSTKSAFPPSLSHSLQCDPKLQARRAFLPRSLASLQSS
jgi:thiamine-phosphate pyrophosphorylase